MDSEVCHFILLKNKRPLPPFFGLKSLSTNVKILLPLLNFFLGFIVITSVIYIKRVIYMLIMGEVMYVWRQGVYRKFCIFHLILLKYKNNCKSKGYF